MMSPGKRYAPWPLTQVCGTRIGNLILNTRSHLHIAYLNTRIVLDTGGRCIIMNTFCNNGTDALCLPKYACLTWAADVLKSLGRIQASECNIVDKLGSLHFVEPRLPPTVEFTVLKASRNQFSRESLWKDSRASRLSWLRSQSTHQPYLSSQPLQMPSTTNFRIYLVLSAVGTRSYCDRYKRMGGISRRVCATHSGEIRPRWTVQKWQPVDHVFWSESIGLRQRRKRHEVTLYPNNGRRVY